MRKRCTAEERALARSTVYRFLGLMFSYPSKANAQAIMDALPYARAGVDLIDDDVADQFSLLEKALQGVQHRGLEVSYQRVFTLTYSEDCPAYETAFSANHIFQQASQQADIAGFYRAFAVEPQNERPDHLGIELEFLYLLTLKEGLARSGAKKSDVDVCRQAQRRFVKDHLGRWASLIADRVEVSGKGTAYAVAARLLTLFIKAEERYLRLGRIERFADQPVILSEEPGDFTCPMEDGEGFGTADLPVYDSVEEARSAITNS